MTSHSSQIQLSKPGGANHRIMSFPIRAESFTNHPEARWFPMPPQAVQTAASAMRSLDEKTMREPSSNGIGSWSWGGFLLGGIWALGNRLWIGYPILLLNALGHAISGHHLRVEAGLSYGLIQLSGKDLAASVRLFNLAIAVWLGYKGNALVWKRGNWKSSTAFVVVSCCGALFILP